MSRLLNSQEADHFRQLIDVYSLHENALEQFRDSNFAVIAGPAGAGKDTLRNGLIAEYPDIYLPILSTTTRPPRAGEIDGITYHFREVEEVEEGLKQREFFQAELVHNQQISCLHISEVQKLIGGRVGLSILITDTQKKLQLIKSDIKTIFLIPPDSETLIQRMQSERMLDSSEIERRLVAAKKEISVALESPDYYCLTSVTIKDVLLNAHEYLSTGKFNHNQDDAARQTMRKIMIEL